MGVELFVGVNGIRSNGSSNTDQMLLQLFNNYDCDLFDFNYRKIQLTDVMLKLRRRNQLSYVIGSDLKHKIDTFENVNIIAHSFGGLVTIRALELGARVNNVFLFSPAAESTEYINTSNVNGNVYIVHHPHDLAILLGAGLIKHDFGNMGRVGSVSLNPKIRNIKCGTIDPDGCKFKIKALLGFNHGNYFLEDNINKWVNFIGSQCKLEHR